MSAGFGWIDFSDEQRQKVFAVIDLLDSSGTVDELGIGVVRDALADWMFPGVSTIQTRPKYFLILIEILSNYQRKYLSGEKVPTLEVYLTDEEKRVMKILAENYNYEGGSGVIGISVAKEGKELARNPSSIYWNGLRMHGLINTHLSRTEYVKANDLSEDETDSETLENYEDLFGLKSHHLEIIHDNMNMDFDREQAIFLKDQFLDTSTHIDKNEHNLLSDILRDKKKSEIINYSNNFRDAAEALLDTGYLHDKTAHIVQMALDFDLLMHGSHIRYNILLHKKAGNPDYQQKLLQLWESWLDDIKLAESRLIEFDFEGLFTLIANRVGRVTQYFMIKWKAEVLKPIVDNDILDELVYKQEVHKKGNKAKLVLKDGAYTGWVGINRLEYRFPVVKNIIKDLEIANA